MSPMKSSFMRRSVTEPAVTGTSMPRPRRSASFGSVMRKLAAGERRADARAVERAGHPHGTRKASGSALDEVIAAGARARRVGPFFAGDEHDAALDQHADAGRRDARQIHEDLKAVVGLEHVERRQTVASGRGPAD